MFTEGLMLSYIIDKMEVRNLEPADITRAFLQKYYDKGDIHIKMEELRETLLDEINPD